MLRLKKVNLVLIIVQIYFLFDKSARLIITVEHCLLRLREIAKEAPRCPLDTL